MAGLSFLTMLVVALFVLGVLIFVHELGHFLVAKWNGVGVLEFAIGFGKKIWKRRIGETTYSIGAIPLGGYVRMVGDDPGVLEGKDPAGKGSTEEKLTGAADTEEEFSPEQKLLLQDRSRWFVTQGFWAKFSIVFAGPFFNLLFAFILAVGSTFLYGRQEPQEAPFIGEVVPGQPAIAAGIAAGDEVVSIDGNPIPNWQVLAKTILSSGGKPLDFLIRRRNAETGNPEEVRLSVTGSSEKSELDFLVGRPEGEKRYHIGIMQDFVRVPATFLESLEYGALDIYGVGLLTTRTLYGMIIGQVSPRNLGGPIFIFSEAGRRAKKGSDSIVEFMILLSVSLAVLNLLPIPILDGGHLLFFIIEALRRRPLSVRVQQIANQVGMLLLLLLMLYAVTNDVIRLIPG